MHVDVYSICIIAYRCPKRARVKTGATHANECSLHVIIYNRFDTRHDVSHRQPKHIHKQTIKSRAHTPRTSKRDNYLDIHANSQQSVDIVVVVVQCNCIHVVAGCVTACEHDGAMKVEEGDDSVLSK